MSYTDEQLKKALAVMLPNLIEYRFDKLEYIAGKRIDDGPEEPNPIDDEKLLHLCWLAEERLSYKWRFYYEQLIDGMPNGAGVHVMTFHASWQQRTIALAKTMGIEIK